MIYLELIFAQKKRFKWKRDKELKHVSVRTLKNTCSTAKNENVQKELSFR